MKNEDPFNDFAVFILTHGRPNNVKTVRTLRNCGYTGPIVLVLDNLDKTADEYRKAHPDLQIYVFDKPEISKTFDHCDNFRDYRSITYARNASFNIARDLGYRYWIQLDDDYTQFSFRFDNEFRYAHKRLKCLDSIFRSMLKFYVSLDERVLTIAMSQGGDFIGGPLGSFGKKIFLRRKAMNSFICSVDRPFKFISTFNEDVCTYVTLGSRGNLFFTVNQISLNQTPTQSNPGGITELYKDYGTYVKSFATVINHPSSVTVEMMQSKNKRLHHKIDWKKTVPMIVRESLRKR
jgi:hypothetical protein